MPRAPHSSTRTCADAQRSVAVTPSRVACSRAMILLLEHVVSDDLDLADGCAAGEDVAV